MSEINCVSCGHSWEEAWPRGMVAIRCSHACSGPCVGYVTQIYPDGKRVLAELADPPVWCGAKKENGL